MTISAYFGPTYSFNSVLTDAFRVVLEKEPVEQTYRKHKLLSMLEKENGSRWQVNGGFNLQFPIGSLGSTRAVPVRGASTVPLTDSDDKTMGQNTMAHYTLGVTIYGTDEAEANTSDRLFDLAKAKKDSAVMEMSDKLDTDLWSSSTVTNGIVGIRLAFPTDGGASSTSYEGHAGATNTFWVSKTNTTGGVASSVLPTRMDSMDQSLRSETSEEYDFIITTYNLERLYKANARTYLSQNMGTGMGKKIADLGYSAAWYDNKPILPDNSCPAGFMYFISSKRTRMAYDPDFNYKFGDFADLTPGQQFGRAAQLHCRMQLVCTERRVNGQISGLTES